MELHEVKNKTYTFQITGNTRHKILNEVPKNNIFFKHGEMYIKTTNPHNFSIPYNKCGILFKYSESSDIKPAIECIWTDYIPLYIIQPTESIDPNILQEFGISHTTHLYKDLLNIDKDEYDKQLNKYNQYLDKEHMYRQTNSISHTKKIIYSSFIFKYDKPICIDNKVQDECSDYEEYTSESDDFTDTYASDD